MAWRVAFNAAAEKAFGKLDHATQSKVRKYLRERIATDQDPRRFGKALTSDFKGLWRYRVDDYRIICRIEDETVTVLVVLIGHRREVYD